MDDKALDQAVKDGWITAKQKEKIPNKNYLVYLAKTNKEKGHKPKPSLTTDIISARPGIPLTAVLRP